MLLPAFALLLNLLLFLQFLSDTSFSQTLALTSLVGLGVEGSFQRGVTAHTHHHLLTQLQMGAQTIWTQTRNWGLSFTTTS